MRILFPFIVFSLAVSACMIVPRPTDQELLALDNPPPAVLEKLDRLFPRVLSWYEQVETELLPRGRPLSPRETDFAIRIGVREPDRIRIVVLDDFPLPSDPELRREVERIGMGSKNEGGRTNGYVIMLKTWAAEDDSIISHELVHVAQQDRSGREPFIRRYMVEMEMMGYARSPLELEAYAKQSRSL